MDPMVAKMCARYCRHSLVITRNEESRRFCANWACRPNWAPIQRGRSNRSAPEYGQKALRDVGWDGKTPVLVICPINPFEWPVKASIAKAALHGLSGRI